MLPAPEQSTDRAGGSSPSSRPRPGSPRGTESGWPSSRCWSRRTFVFSSGAPSSASSRWAARATRSDAEQQFLFPRTAPRSASGSEACAAQPTTWARIAFGVVWAIAVSLGARLGRMPARPGPTPSKPMETGSRSGSAAPSDSSAWCTLPARPSSWRARARGRAEGRSACGSGAGSAGTGSPWTRRARRSRRPALRRAAPPQRHEIALAMTPESTPLEEAERDRERPGARSRSSRAGRWPCAARCSGRTAGLELSEATS